MARCEEHLAELLKLSPEERARAARLLLESLDDGTVSAEAAAELRLAELTRRAQDVHDGNVELVEVDEVRRAVRARLQALRDR